MEVILIVGVLIMIGIAFGSAIIASSKGRSGFGWFFLTLIFPIAILFVAIAGPVNGAAQERPAQNPSPTRNPVRAPSHTASLTATSNDQPSHSDQAKTLDWEKLLKYDPDIMKAFEKLQAYGEPAVEEFKEAYEAVGGDRTVINHITDVIIKDLERKEFLSQNKEIALSENKKKTLLKKQQREDLNAKVLKALDKDKNDKLDMVVNILGLQFEKHDDTCTFVRLTKNRGYVVNHSSGRDEMVSNIVKILNDDELDRLVTALE